MSDTVSASPPIAIRAEISIADPGVCKFTVSETVHPGGPYLFRDHQSAAGSPLVERLFALPGVSEVLVADNVVTVGKSAGASWDGLKADIGAVIRNQRLTGVRAILEASQAPPPSDRSDEEIRAAVQALLDQETNPSIAAHGGKIVIVEVRDRSLYLEMSGGCQGCAASQVTLREGFERMARRVAPELVNVVDVTDHEAGQRPFYRQATVSTVSASTVRHRRVR